MRYRILTVFLGISFWLGAAWERAPAQTEAPFLPKLPELENCPKFSGTDFERLIVELKKERDALAQDTKSLSRRLAAGKNFNDREQEQFDSLVKHALQRLQQERYKPIRVAQPNLVPPVKDQKSVPEPKKKDDDKPPVEIKLDPTPTPPMPAPAILIDAVQLGQSLFRAERYEEALASFEKVDLTGKTAEERAPILFLMAACHERLGRQDQAVNKLREVANIRGDERFAGYAQWQLELVRWQRDARTRLQDIRQRRQALEKRP